jgi:hypothetical protein
MDKELAERPELPAEPKIISELDPIFSHGLFESISKGIRVG